MNKYAMFRCIAMNDYPELLLRKNQPFKLNISPDGFERAVQRFFSYYRLPAVFNGLKTNLYVLDITLKRISKKIVIIEDIKIYDKKDTLYWDSKPIVNNAIKKLNLESLEYASLYQSRYANKDYVPKG